MRVRRRTWWVYKLTETFNCSLYWTKEKDNGGQKTSHTMLPATAEWWDAMTALYQRSNDARGVDPEFTQSVLAEPTFRTHMWLLVVEQRLVGMLRRVNGEISCVTVHPDERRRGWGRTMMEWLRDQREPFQLTCLSSNVEALAFYRRLPWLREGPTIEHTSRRHKISYGLVYFDFLTVQRPVAKED